MHEIVLPSLGFCLLILDNKQSEGVLRMGTSHSLRSRCYQTECRSITEYRHLLITTVQHKIWISPFNLVGLTIKPTLTVTLTGTDQLSELQECRLDVCEVKMISTSEHVKKIGDTYPCVFVYRWMKAVP